MKRVLLLCLLFSALIACNKNSPAPTVPPTMTTQLNGQSWSTAAGTVPPYAQIDHMYTYTPERNVADIFGESVTDLTTLGIKHCQISLGTTYLPKLGRHYVNTTLGGPIGTPNAAMNYLSINMQYQHLDGVTYNAYATSGFVEITEVTDTYVAGTFEFAATEFTTTPGVIPLVFKAEKGQFKALLIKNTTLPISWDGVQ